MSIFYKTVNLKCGGREKKGFVLDRPNGSRDFLFLHFKTPVSILQEDGVVGAPPGTCLVTVPGRRHWFESPDCDLEHDWVHFMPDNPEAFLKLGFPVNRLFFPMRTGFIAPVMKDCQEEFINREMFWEESASALLGRLFILLARESSREKVYLSSPYMRGLYDKFVRFRVELHANPEKPISVAAMAAGLSLSRSRFTVLYQKFFGISPKDDLIGARIAYAKYLLDLNGMKIQAVSDMAGYTSVYHFIRQFKRVTGITPGGYRAR